MSVNKIVAHFCFNAKPTPKARPRFSRGRVYTPKKTKQFESTIKLLAQMNYKAPPCDGALECHVKFIFKNKKIQTHHTKKPDLDNVLKSLFDSLNGIVWKDDSQVINVLASKEYGIKDSIELIVYEVE